MAKLSPQISVIIPTYNEQGTIKKCIKSLKDQSYKQLEIIIVDDGSNDNTLSILKKTPGILLFSQNHQGPGTARNLGSKKAKGEILVFADADMTFDKDFIKDLTEPIVQKKTIGTFSKNELNANWQKPWSACWNINRGWPVERLIPKNYPNVAPVFRAILKSQFEKVEGFTTDGDYTDDWSLSKKLGKKSTLASGAIYYHANPESLKEVWNQARWIGKNRFIAGTFLRRAKSLIKYSFPISLAVGIYKSIAKGQLLFVMFKIWYDFAVWSSVVSSFFAAKKYK